MPYVLVADGIITQEQYEESIRRLTDGAKTRMESADEWPVAGLLARTGSVSSTSGTRANRSRASGPR